MSQKTLQQEPERSAAEHKINDSPKSTFTGLFGAVNEGNTSEIGLNAYRRLGVVRT